MDDGSDALKAKNSANTHWGPSSLDLVQSDASDWSAFIRQVGNIREKPVQGGGYSSFKMVNPKFGDDLFDAACASVWALITRGESGKVPTVIGTRAMTPEQLLGAR